MPPWAIFFSFFSLNLLSAAVTVLTKARWNVLSYSIISEAAWLENQPQKAIAGNYCAAYYKLLWFMVYVFGISLSFRSLKPRESRTEDVLSVSSGMWLTMKMLRCLLMCMDIITCVQVFFDYFALVIGKLIAEVIGAFWAIGAM